MRICIPKVKSVAGFVYGIHNGIQLARGEADNVQDGAKEESSPAVQAGAE